MPRGNLAKVNFNAGEWSPLMEGRTDLDKYFSSCRNILNMVSLPQGGVTKRSGTKYIAEVKDSTKKVRLVPFRATDDSNYILEFGHLYIRMFKSQAVVGAPTEVATTYDVSDIYELKFAQSADTLVITHEDYAIRELVRVSNTSWAFRTKTFNIEPTTETAGYLGSTLNASATLTPSATSGINKLFTAGASVFLANDVGRKITMVDSVAGVTYSGITVDITQYVSGTQVYGTITGTFPDTSAIAAGGWRLTLTPSGSITPSSTSGKGAQCSITLTDGELSRTNCLSSGNDWWTIDGTANGYYMDPGKGGSGSIPATEPSAVYVGGVKWTKWPVAGVPTIWGYWRYGDFDTLGSNTIYIADNLGDPDAFGLGDDYIQYTLTGDDNSAFRTQDVGKYVYVHSGAVKITAFVSAEVVTGQIVRSLTSADETAAWTLEDSLFDNADGAGNENPAAVAFYEDRLWFGGTPSNSQSFFGSVTGIYDSFFKGTADDDAIIETILSRTLTNILWLEPRDSLFVGTTGGVWKIDGGSLETAITPSNKNVRQVTTQASAQDQGVSVGSSLLYIHEQSQKIYNVEQETSLTGKQATEVSIMADHIGANNLEQFALQQDPYNIVWMRRGDGAVVGLTYNQSQDIIAFHRLTTGSVESVAVITGDTYDELWLAVNRTINDSTVRYIEVMQQFFEKTYPSDTTAAFFADAGKTVSQASSTTVSGYTHLVAETVQVMVNGKRHKDLTVSATGTLTLDYAGTSITAGIGYESYVETQYLEASGGQQTTQGLKQRVSNVFVNFHNTVSAQIGPSTSDLDELNFREPSDGMSTALPLFTGIKTAPNPGGYDDQQSVVVYQNVPLPMTIRSIVATLEVGDP
jgi:hypothetical protein